MSTLTSLVGLLPLIIFPGAGSELYRELESWFLVAFCCQLYLCCFSFPLMAVLMRRIKAQEPIGDMTEEITAQLSQTA